MDDTFVQNLNKLIATYRQNPELLIWGEIFHIFHFAKKTSKPLYNINPNGDIIYNREKRKFIVRIPDMEIHLKDHELVDAILYKGLFHPLEKYS
jgi:hypothetical protein